MNPSLRSTRSALVPIVSAFLLLSLTGLLGCSSDSPTEPDEVLFFAGTVPFQDISTQNFTMTVDGLLQLSLDEVTPQVPDGVTVGDGALVIGFSLGRQSENGCATSGAIAISRGQSVSYGIDRGDYCLYFYDAGRIPVDGAFDYEVTVRMTDF